MQRTRWLAVALLLGVEGRGAANLCDKSTIGQGDRDEAAAAAAELFSQPFVEPTSSTTNFLGDPDYDAWVLACNRKRDTKANEVEKVIRPSKTFANDLPARTVKGFYNYFGLLLFQQRYSYQLRREKGTWIVTIPMEFHLPTMKMKSKIDIPEGLSIQLGLDQPGQLCAKGQTQFKDSSKTGKSLLDSGNILLGYIEDEDLQASDLAPTVPDTTVGAARYEAACRVDQSLRVNDTGIVTLLKRFWRDRMAANWTRPGFRIETLIVGDDSIAEAQLTAWRKDETVWQVRWNLRPGSRPVYKADPVHNVPLYSGVPEYVFTHEMGHVLGLDDEYIEGDKPEWRDCSLKGGNAYLMCHSIRGRSGAKGIYPWIATRRYAIAEALECKSDADCVSGSERCAKHGLNRNVCEPLVDLCGKCGSDKECAGGRTCKGGNCITESTISVGESCCADAQCRSGSCNGDGECQCKNNGDCNPGQFCEGNGLGANECRGQVGECGKCGNDGECRSGDCRGGQCVTAGSVALGRSCCHDTECASGSCNGDRLCQLRNPLI